MSDLTVTQKLIDEMETGINPAAWTRSKEQAASLRDIQEIHRRNAMIETVAALTDEECDEIARKQYHTARSRNGDYTGFRKFLVEDQLKPEYQRTYKMIQQSGTPQGTSIATTMPQQQQSQQATDLSFYQRIANPIDAAEQLGVWLHRSAMMGVGTKEAGIVIATTCLTERISPLEFTRRYHIIENKPSMRSDFMLAKFQELGGEIEIHSRNAMLSDVSLTWKGRTNRFAFSWEDAQQEPFVKDKNGKIKTNYASPRSRMQMLWARCISDGIRTICPQVNSGSYSPEETSDMLGIDAEPGVIDAEFTTVETAKQVTTPAAVATLPSEGTEPGVHSGSSPATVPSGREPLRENGGVSAILNENIALATAAQSAAATPQPGQSSEGATGKVTQQQLEAIALLKKPLNISKEDWLAILASPQLGSVKTAHDLTSEAADRLRKFLRKKVDALPHSKENESAQMRDDQSRWADGELMPHAAQSSGGNSKN